MGNSMDRYGVAIKVLDEGYVDQLIISLVRQGYAVYYNSDEKVVCYTAEEDEITKIKKDV